MNFLAQIAANPVTPTGIPMLDGLLVSSPLAGVLYLWVRSLQRDKEKWESDRAALMRQVLMLAETQVELNTTLRERLSLIERHLGLREGGGK